MKRALWLLSVPAVAIVAAALVHGPSHHEAASALGTTAENAPTAAPTSNWVAATILPHPPRAAIAAAQAKQAGPKPPTESRTALMDSHPPIVAPLSIDQLGSPRERLFAATHGASPERQTQLDRLSDRTATQLDRMKAARDAATGEQRAVLDKSISRLERNQSYRARVVKPSVRVPARPGTSIAAGNFAAGAGTLPAPTNKPAAQP